MHDIYFENNFVGNAGYGWSHGQRPDPLATFILLSLTPAENYNIFIRNNTFDGTADYGICQRDKTSWNGIENVVIDYNTYTIASDNMFLWGSTTYMATSAGVAAYQAASGKDDNSTFNIGN
jgi:hypothetical protein